MEALLALIAALNALAVLLAAQMNKRIESLTAVIDRHERAIERLMNRVFNGWTPPPPSPPPAP